MPRRPRGEPGAARPAAAALSPVGFAITTQYVSRALARIGVVPEILAKGRYKSAGESRVRGSMSDAQREQLDALVDGFHVTLLDAIAAGRGTDVVKARAIVDGAPYMGEEAVRAGLADATVYDDGLLERVVPSGAKSLGPRGPLPRAPETAPARPLPARGVIEEGRLCVHGAIVQGRGAPWMTATDDRVMSAIRLARESKRVLGVVLHVDSPGGSALWPPIGCTTSLSASRGTRPADRVHGERRGERRLLRGRGRAHDRRPADDHHRVHRRRGGSARAGPPPGEAGGLHGGRLPLERARRPPPPDAPASRSPATSAPCSNASPSRSTAPSSSAVAEGPQEDVRGDRSPRAGRVWSGADAHARGLPTRLGGFDRALEIVRERVGASGAGLLPVVIHAPRAGASQEEHDLGRARCGARLGLRWRGGSRSALARTLAREGPHVDPDRRLTRSLRGSAGVAWSARVVAHRREDLRHHDRVAPRPGQPGEDRWSASRRRARRRRRGPPSGQRSA